VKGRLLLDVVVRQRATILELFTSENETLLVWGNTLLVLNLGLDILNGVRGLDFERDRLARQRLHEDLHTTTKTEDQVKGRLLLNVVVGQGTAIFELLAGEDETLLVWWNTFLVLNLGLDIFDSVGGLDLQGDGLAGQRLDEDLHTTTQAQNQVKGRLLLDVVVRQRAAILKLFAGEDKTLLIWGNALLVLDFRFDVLNGVRGFHLQRDRLASERLDENLHATTESENQMQSGLLLDIVVGQGAAIFELLAGEDETLLVWGNTLLVLDLSLDVLDGVRGFNFKGDRLASQRLDKDLHATAETEHQVKGRLLLDVVVGKSATVLELLTGKDQTLLVWWDALLVLDLGLDILDGIRCLNLQGDGLASQRLDEDLHATTKTQDQVQG